ncbi:DUF4354 family protein [Enterobacter ludwigii]|uniref:DUF4354 family protein n=1 Tax=Enterobacter ludwigii TaxID=299767 RepID=UPI003D1F973B
MLKIKLFILCGMCLLSVFNVMASDYPVDITVNALKESNGSEWDSVKNSSEYIVTYKVNISNNSKKMITPGIDNKLCFFLDDNNGHTLLAKSVQLELLTPYHPGESRDGIVYFSSKNRNLVDLPFVKMGLGKQCTKIIDHGA